MPFSASAVGRVRESTIALNGPLRWSVGPWKGVAIAIRAIAETDHWRLVVVGGGFDEMRLRRLARRLNVGDRVRFTGWLTKEEVLDRMRKDADVFVFPSMHEEAGLVVVEALASGLPVICLDKGGPPLLAGGAGLVLRSSVGLDEVVSGLARLLAAGGSLNVRKSTNSWSPSDRKPAFVQSGHPLSGRPDR
jgi:glycosyltransferase involved in cell wall biosynthesis